jgi:hypothetical protein
MKCVGNTSLLFSDSVKINIKAAMAHWEEHTCIKFVPWTTEKDYIEIAPGRCG